MTSDVKKTREPQTGEEWGIVSVSFGAVTVKIPKPSESVRRANIEAGQAALLRGKSAITKAGVKIPREKGTPLYFGCEDRPGWMVRELDGKKTLGKFVGGRFRAERIEGNSATPKRKTKA